MTIKLEELFAYVAWKLMADRLQKFKFDGKASSEANTKPRPTTRRQTLATQSNTDQPQLTSTELSGMDADSIKADILACLRADFKEIIREELKSALAEDFSALKSEIQGLKAEFANDAKALREEMVQIRSDIQDMDGGLSSWSDEVTSLRNTVSSLQKEMTTMREKCEDMEGRMRRSNIRIAGIAEQANSSSPTAVSNAIKAMLHLDRDIKVDRSHRVLTRGSTGDRERPRVIIAKLHYDEDATEILRKARDNAPLLYEGQRVSIFPDYTANVAKARAAFTEVRKVLRGQKDIRYGLFFPARFRITYQEETREFVDHRKAMAFAKSILPTGQQLQDDG